MNELIRPNDNDVLAGRGYNTTQHPGNKKLRALVAVQRGLYAGTTNSQKQVIISQIVEQIQNSDPPGRYLKKTEGIWHQMESEFAKRKTGQLLREHPKNPPKEQPTDEMEYIRSGLDPITLDVDALDVLDTISKSGTSLDSFEFDDENVEPLHHSRASVQSMSISSSWWSSKSLLNTLQSLSSRRLFKWNDDSEDKISLENNVDVKNLDVGRNDQDINISQNMDYSEACEMKSDKNIQSLHHSPLLGQSPSPLPCTDNEMSESSVWSTAGLLTGLQPMSSMSLLFTRKNHAEDNMEAQDGLDYYRKSIVDHPIDEYYEDRNRGITCVNMRGFMNKARAWAWTSSGRGFTAFWKSYEDPMFD